MEKQLPQNIEAEQGVLGSIIIDPAAIVEISSLVYAKDFYRDSHKTIFEVITYLSQRQEPADFLTICDELERRNQLEHVGGAGYLTSLINHVPTSSNAEYYAKIVARTSELREIIRIAGEIAGMAYREEENTLQQAEEKILKIGQTRAKQDFVSLPEYLPTYLNTVESRMPGASNVLGMSTGMRTLDALLGKLRRGRLYIPASRPGVGKTTICQNIAYRGALKHGYKVGFFSVEMSKDDLMDRFMSMHTRIDSMRLQNGDLEKEEKEKIYQAVEDMDNLGIFFEYTPGIFLDELASMSRRLVQKHGLDLLVIDYIQLIRARIDGKRIQMREMEVAEVARGLKILAGELNVPVLAPAQINRQVERSAVIEDERTGLHYRMPILADLRESGELEQSADVVMFLARAEEDETKVKLNIAKNRSGAVGNVDLYFEGATTRFMPIASQYDEYGNIVEA